LRQQRAMDNTECRSQGEKVLFHGLFFKTCCSLS
jgi:hypothetical protein